MNATSPTFPIDAPWPSYGDFLSQYLPPPHLHDEMRRGDGSVRPHWRLFVEHLHRSGLPDVIRRWEEAKRIIRENGVTYNVYGDPRGMARPWQLDPIPNFLSGEDFATLEAGLVQRATLLNAILQDLYGPQQLVREGLFPAELLYANSGFLRSCHGLPLPQQRYLHLYAANIGRDASGRFVVLGDRTQSPSGAGYALENRIVLSRMMPDIFRECRVHRIAGYFRTMRDTLRGLAPSNRDNPRIVLLTPGPYNETYFEHAYLARYLGYTLVEGSDLTVRDNRVYLKLLGGLQPVDVILRRMDDDFCDPVELRADSFLGVPGLVQAVRSNTVAIANALGTGLIETPALLPFLPQLCRRVLQEELKLASATSWWCGDTASRNHVLANLEKLVLKPTFASSRGEPVFADRLTQPELRELEAKIRAKPRDYVGQEITPLSTTPVLVGDRMQPRQTVLRTYLVATESGYMMMPGGLTRVSATPDTMVVSMQRGGGSKDTWVLADGPVSEFSLLRAPSAPVALSREGGDLSSRVADNLFWLGRYVERAEAVARLLRGVVGKLTEQTGTGSSPEWSVLLRTLTEQTQSYPGFVGAGSEKRLRAPEDEIRSLIFDSQRAGTLGYTLAALLRVAGTVRDRLSTDMWRVLHAAASGHAPIALDHWPLTSTLELINRTVLNLAAFAGLASESMTRGQGWRFLDMGRKLERSVQILTLLQHTLTVQLANEPPLLETILEISDSLMTYRRRYLATLQTTAVIDLLFSDESNPRSVAYQLAALADDVEHLPHDTEQAGRTAEQRLMLSVLTRVRLADPERLAEADKRGKRAELSSLTQSLVDELPGLSELITQRYLTHLQTSRHLGKDFRSLGN